MKQRSPRTRNQDDGLGKTELRRTPARELVLEVLRKAQRPLSHQDLARTKKAGTLDRVTLYRCLAALQRAGLLHSVLGSDGVWRFRAHDDGHRCGGNHVHFVCVDCGEMSCLVDQPLPWVPAPAGAEVFGKQLVVRGRCARCGARQGKRK